MTDAVVGGVLTFGAFDVVVFAAIVYLVTKLVRRVTGAPTSGPKLRDDAAIARSCRHPMQCARRRSPNAATARRSGAQCCAPPTRPTRQPSTAHLAAVFVFCSPQIRRCTTSRWHDHILTFLTSRLHDYPCSAPVLGGLHALINHTHELDAALVQTLTFTLLEEVDVRSLVQAERQAALALTLALAQKRSAALAPSGVRMLLSALRAFDAEKDPRQPHRLPPAAARAHAPLRRRAAGGARRRTRRDLRRVGAPVDRVLSAARRPGTRHVSRTSSRRTFAR